MAHTGLTTAQVQAQQAAGHVNRTATTSTPVSKIISKNLFTLFNLINLVIAGLIMYTGSYANLLFLGPVIANFIIGSYQEIKAKKQLDQLTFLNRQRVTVWRDNQRQQIFQDDLVLGDIICLRRGDQVPADGRVCQTEQLEIDESNLTGESVAIIKQIGDSVLSGSIVVGGQAEVELTAVGADSFANRLAKSARQQQHHVSQLLSIINRIIQVLTYIIIPLGLILFCSSYFKNHHLNQAILGTSASIIGMIPQGLVLLTSVALAVGTMHLGHKQVLVKSMTALEALARVDTLCLDKTGTITTGNLQLAKIVPQHVSSNEVRTIAQKIMLATQESNETAQALLQNCTLQLAPGEVDSIVPFSSQRKWSAANFTDHQSYAIGAPNFLLHNQQQLTQAQQFAAAGYRVLAVVQSPQPIKTTIEQPQLLGFCLISDEIRATAQDTFDYLRQQGIKIKVISGDDPKTVQTIAQQVQLPAANQAVDMSTIPNDADFAQLVQEYTVFGRTLPEQKQKLLQALQQNQHKVAMAGDGVNDVLAMRQSDCGIAIAGNSDAAESAADFVLLNKNFDSLIFVLNEGRRVINNIERVAALYLIKTIYSIMLTLLFILLHANYPFYPAQMTPVNALTVGIPTFFLALQPDFRPPAGRFYRNVFQVALPAAVDVTLTVGLLTWWGHWQNWSYAQTSTLAVLAISLLGFAALWTIARPINRGIIVIFLLLFCVNAGVFVGGGGIFKIKNILIGNLQFPSLLIIILFYPLFLISRELVVRYILK